MQGVEFAKDLIQKEIRGLELLFQSLDEDEKFNEALQVMSNVKGKVIVTAVGKSGHVGKKIAASLASTGTPSFFIHSTEGVHGDLGMVEQEDVVIMISNSGETLEVLNLLPTLKKIGVTTISITRDKESTLAQASDIALSYTYEEEADHLNLAPTTSSTICLVIGDALACALSNKKDFTKEDFHLYHPGGSLGRNLST
ncbi:KpsF/GutQ family sugar-phosphate isomerase [Aquisalibacillus elongatus]|uniref:Arabinose-5-phosphate isomerase n=1 Tax=Aquisalibacillus elongatus TaxID=485577 RepID=A0A3N5BG46_9BACI|nr:SIS domain-containing protein [Aquisalibacillus elongatus]RPF54240.1 arabinose-5-phosphate isomerase [Aquisalibacillus elongatus]